MFSKVKKLFSILAIAMMVTSVLPLNVLADETTTANTENVIQTIETEYKNNNFKQ